MDDIRAVILAGGRGTRLKPFTITFPKPLMPVGDMPILEILLRQIHKFGITDVTLTLGYQAELIRAYFSQKREGLEELRIRYVEESEPTGTAGSLSMVPGLDRTFLVLNGDILTNLDIKKLVEYHREKGAVLTIAAARKHVKIDLGVLKEAEDGWIEDYIEKPEMDYLVSMGIYVYEPSVLEYIPRGQYLDFPHLVLNLLGDGRRVATFHFDGLWLDIGRPEDYARAQEHFSANRDHFDLV
jgi:NDP-sugar pyrophosphorylase family protein